MKQPKLTTSINPFMLAVGKLKLDSVKMLKLIGNLKSRVKDLERELAGLKQDS